MVKGRQFWFWYLALLSAAVLLFIVLFPYTPTPIATTIGKLLLAAVLVFACIANSLVIVSPVHILRSFNPLRRFIPGRLLDFICTRLR